jgi:hypothetical protein
MSWIVHAPPPTHVVTGWVEVIEKAPVLDLLARVVCAAYADRCCDGRGCWQDHDGAGEALKDAEALLIAHGGPSSA